MCIVYGPPCTGLFISRLLLGHLCYPAKEIDSGSKETPVICNAVGAGYYDSGPKEG